MGEGQGIVPVQRGVKKGVIEASWLKIFPSRPATDPDSEGQQNLRAPCRVR